jgi:hypothetical protein
MRNKAGMLIQERITGVQGEYLDIFLKGGCVDGTIPSKDTGKQAEDLLNPTFEQNQDDGEF